MIYNNGTISVHKNHIGNLLFAVVISGLVEDVLEARKMIRAFKNEALLELEDYYSVGVDGCIEEQLKRAIDILDNLKIRAKVQIDFYGDGGDTGIEGVIPSRKILQSCVYYPLMRSQSWTQAIDP